MGDAVGVELVPLFLRLLPDELWSLLQSLIPPGRVRPQGGGRGRVDDRRVAFAVIYVLVSGCSWRRLPQSFGVAVPTAYRRYAEWSTAEVWTKLLDHIAEHPVGDPVWICMVARAALNRFAADNGRASSEPIANAVTDQDQPLREGEEAKARVAAALAIAGHKVLSDNHEEFIEAVHALCGEILLLIQQRGGRS